MVVYLAVLRYSDGSGFDIVGTPQTDFRLSWLESQAASKASQGGETMVLAFPDADALTAWAESVS